MTCPECPVELNAFRSMECDPDHIFGLAFCRLGGEIVRPIAVLTGSDGMPVVTSDPILRVAPGVRLDLSALFGGIELSALPQRTRERLIQVVENHFAMKCDGGCT